MPQHWYYWISGIISALLFGFATPFSKELLSHMHPFLLAGLFYLGAALILFPKVLHLQLRLPLKHISRTDILQLAGSLFFGGMVGPVFFLYGLNSTDATNGSLLLNLETPATALLAYWFFRENIGVRAAFANLGILAGAVLLTFEGTSLPGIGGVLIALACISWGLDNNFTASIHSIDPIRATFLKGIVFGSANFVIGALLTDSWPSIQVIFWALVIGAFSYGLSIVLYIASSRGLGAARSQMIFASAPFWGVALSQIYLGEAFHVYQITSIALFVSMLILLFTEPHEHLHTHEFIEHSHRHTHDDGHHIHAHDEMSDSKIAHTHRHTHEPLSHSHPHWPDIHHRHKH